MSNHIFYLAGLLASNLLISKVMKNIISQNRIEPVVVKDRSDLKIVQYSRESHPFGGVPGVVHALELAFNALGVKNETRVYKDKGGVKTNGRLMTKLQTLIDVVGFTVRASVKIYFEKRNPNEVILVHTDALGGDVYIDHGLHKAVVLNNPILFLKNPIHIFVYMREYLRHRFSLYRRVGVLSNLSAKNLMKHYPYVNSEKLFYVGNGVNIDRFSIDEKRKYAVDGDLKLIFVGHEFDRKGLRYIIEAMASLPHFISLSVVGGSASDIEIYRSIAKNNGVEERTHFLGRRKDVPALLSAHDVFVMPSSFESSALALMEAMAAGLPVLSTATGAAEELIKSGEQGFIIQPSGTDIAERISHLLASPSSMLTMGRNARIVAEANSWIKVAERYVKLAEDVLAERRI